MTVKGTVVKQITWTAVALAFIAALAVVAIFFLIPADQAEARSSLLVAVTTIVGGIVTAKFATVQHGQQVIQEGQQVIQQSQGVLQENMATVKKQTNGQLARLLERTVELERTIAELQAQPPTEVEPDATV